MMSITFFNCFIKLVVTFIHIVALLTYVLPIKLLVYYEVALLLCLLHYYC